MIVLTRSCSSIRVWAITICTVMLVVAGLKTSFNWCRSCRPENSELLSIESPSLSTALAKLIRVTMLYGADNYLYERAVRTHERHAERWGHHMRTLRHEIMTGFWNKPTYILHILIEEMAKSPADRAEWLM